MSIESCEGGNMFSASEIGALTGEAGLGCRLFIELKLLPWNAPPEKAAVLRALSADVRIRGANGRELLVGRAFRAEATVVKQYDTRAPTNIRLALDLSHQQLEAWERARQGGTFNLGVSYQGLLSRPSGLEGVSGTDQRVISQSEWIAALEAMAFRRLILLEVPVPADAAHPKLAAATRALGQAQAHMLHGKQRDAIGACRDALEALATALADTPEDHDPAALLKAGRGLSKGARFTAHRRMLTVITHLARHNDETGVDTEWHYEDAHAILAHTAAVLGYYGSRLASG